METKIKSGTTDLGRILLLEDDPTYRMLIRDFLVQEGYVVLEADRADAAMKLIRHSLPSAALVDWTLPGTSGLGFCRDVRAAGFLLPIIFLSARTDMDSQVEALRQGADDFLVKPVSLPLLGSRLRSVTRPFSRQLHESVRLPLLDADFDPVAGTIIRSGAVHRLPTKESGMLEMLLRAGGRTVSRQELLAGVWRFHYLPETRSVDVYLMNLRKTLQAIFDGGVQVRTIRGRGFALKVADRCPSASHTPAYP